MRALLLLLSLFSCLCAEEGSPPQLVPMDDSVPPPPPSAYTEDDVSLSAEGVPSTFVNNVNTVFGNLLLPTVDLIVPGPTPLPLIRYYNSDNTLSKWLHGIGMSTNYPLWIRGYCDEFTFSGIHPHADDLSSTPPRLTPMPYVEHPSPPPETGRYPQDDDEEYDTAPGISQDESLQNMAPSSFHERKKGKSKPPKEITKENRLAHAYAEEDYGSILHFSARPACPKMVFYLSPKTTHKGLTNVGSGDISGRTNLKNIRYDTITKKNSHHGAVWEPETYTTNWVVTLSDGGERRYRERENFYNEQVIAQESKPNGNKLLFEHGEPKDWGSPLHKIRAVDHTQNHTFGWLEVEYAKKHKRISVHASNGKTATYNYKRHSSKKAYDAPYITRVCSSDQPFSEYAYTDCDDRYLISKITHPDGRYLKIGYDKKGRVIEQRGPVGKNNAEASIYRFVYHPHEHFTTVYDAVSSKSVFHYSPKKRLESIERFDAENKCVREDIYFWGKREHIVKGEHDYSDEGHLLGRAVRDAEGIASCTRYTYDDNGNILEEELFGDCTGTSRKYFSLDNGIPNGPVESYKKSAKYHDDRFHMCQEKSEESGLTLTFSYKKDTNLLQAKYTQDSSAIKIREFFDYDADAVLVRKIIDDGSNLNQDCLTDVTERHITYIMPVRGEAFGVGQPAEVCDCYYDVAASKEVLLKRTFYEYYREGRVSKETIFDENNTERYSIEYAYDGKGNLTHKTHSAGKEYIYSYDANSNKIREELLSSGFHKEFSYGAANRLIREREVHNDGKTFSTVFSYDAAGHKISTTNRYGQETLFLYDTFGYVKSTSYPLMLDQEGEVLLPVEHTEYDVFHNPKSVTDRNGSITTYERTVRGQPTSITYPDGSSERFIYNRRGTLAKKVDRHGIETTYSYDVFGRVLQTTVSGKKTVTHTYSSFHEVACTDAMGTETTYAYDGAGRLVEECKAGQRTAFSYDELGRKCSEKEFCDDGSYIETCVSYDLFDRLVEEKEQYSDGTLLSQKKYSYDILDNRIAVMTYSSADTCFTEQTLYNSQSLPTKYTDAAGHSTRYMYDHAWKNELNQSVLMKTTIDPLGNQTIEVSDAHHRLSSVEKHNALSKTLSKTCLSYDAKGNKTKERHFVYNNGVLLREYVVACAFSPCDQIIFCIEQPGTAEEKKTVYTYLHNILATIEKPDGTIISHTYDDMARLSTLVSSDGSVHYTYGYDLNDNILYVQDMVLRLIHTKTYDSLDRVVEDQLGTGIESFFSYDALDRVTHASFEGNDVDYRYKAGKLKNVVRQSFGKDVYTHSYDSFDLRGNVTKSSAIQSCGTIQQDWDALNRLERLSSQHFDENCARFDDVGNLLEIRERDPLGALTYAFSYDDLYQLIGEKGLIDISYENDSLYNRLKKNDAPYTMNGLNQLLAEAGTPYIYDKNGNPIQIGSLKLFYDALDRLIAVEQGNFRTEYGYDASHRRLFRKTHCFEEGDWREERSEQFIFFNKREVGSVDEDGKIQEFRVLGLGRGAELGASIALEIAGRTYCPIHDHRGNIAVLIDAATKKPADTYRYTAFGEERVSWKTSNPWRFASKRTDPETGFVFFGRRYYAPSIGRFVTPDPVGFSDGPNLYAYVRNSPLILVDPYGLSVTDSIGSSCTSATDSLSGSMPSEGMTSSSTLSSLGNELASLFSDALDTLKDFFGGKSSNGLAGGERGSSLAFGARPSVGGAAGRGGGAKVPHGETPHPTQHSGEHPQPQQHNEPAAQKQQGKGQATAVAENEPPPPPGAKKEVSPQQTAEEGKAPGAAKQELTRSRNGSSFKGMKGFELKSPSDNGDIPFLQNRNGSTNINGIDYKGHAVDQMENRGIPPSVVENTIENGKVFKSNSDQSCSVHYEETNNVQVVVNQNGEVVTVMYGKPGGVK